MIFNALIESNSKIDSYLISANTWSQCVSYLDSLGKKINNISINENSPNIIVNNQGSTECYNITLKNNTTNQISIYYIFDSCTNSFNWAQQQSGLTISSFSNQTKTFVVL